MNPARGRSKGRGLLSRLPKLQGLLSGGVEDPTGVLSPKVQDILSVTGDSRSGLDTLYPGRTGRVSGGRGSGVGAVGPSVLLAPGLSLLPPGPSLLAPGPSLLAPGPSLLGPGPSLLVRGVVLRPRPGEVTVSLPLPRPTRDTFFPWVGLCGVVGG